VVLWKNPILEKLFGELSRGHNDSWPRLVASSSFSFKHIASTQMLG
jgi:hypothetical protein